MPKLVNHDSVSEDTVSLLDTDADISSLSNLDSSVAIPLKKLVALSEPDELGTNRYSVWLAADDDVEHLKDYLENIDLVILHVENFMDGRFFSQARMLREHFDFEGDIRTHGQFIQDQVFYLSRCGVSSFSVSDDTDIESLQKSLKDFSESYQASCDEPQPLFRRRA